MCFHTKQTEKVKRLEEHYSVGLYKKQEDARESFDLPYFHQNGFDHPFNLIIPQEASQVLIVGKWGIVPETYKPEETALYYTKQIKWGSGLNAQSEKAYGYYFYEFNEAILHRRCIIPVTGFYEPHTLPNNAKIPFHIKKKDDGIISFAGIYSVLEGGLVTYTIFTKKASSMFAEIHNSKKRQPLMLGQDETKVWLNQDSTEDEITELLTYELDNNQLEAYPVSKDLNRRVDSNVSTITNKIDYRQRLKEIKNFDLDNYQGKPYLPHLFN